MTGRCIRGMVAWGLWALAGSTGQAVERPPLLAPPLVEAVRIEGLRATSEAAALRLLGIQTGERLDAAAVWSGRRRLLAQGWYESVQLRLARGTSAGAVVVVVSVRELGAFALTADLSSFSSGVLSLGARYQPPGRASVSTELFLGEEILGYALGLDVPDLSGSKLSVSARLYRRGRESLFPASVRVPVEAGTDLTDGEIALQTGVSFSRTGLSVELGRELGPLSLSLGHRIENLEGDNLNGEIALGGERKLVSALSLGLASATLDAEPFPTRGHRARLRLSLGGEATGSDYGFSRLTGQAEQWLRLAERLAARLQVRGGAIGGEAPFSEHFFAEDLVRGYGSFTASGALGARSALGGGAELALELRPPMGLRRLRLLGFGELGGLWGRTKSGRPRSGSVASFGVGFQLLTGFGALGVSVPLWTKHVEAPPAETLPRPGLPSNPWP